MSSPLLVAFHLPQFHPIPENDAWWGTGFTEWTNVRAATPLMPRHDQPHEPGELGYYDLRDPAVRDAQAKLAREHGIGAFCYYHYWFHGRRLLEQPVEAIRASGQPDFPFCLCWANEPWGRNWDGSSAELLMPQRYSREDDIAHIRTLIPYFQDRRYLRLDGKPAFLVYRASHRPDIADMNALWRDESRKAGLELMLLRVDSHSQGEIDPRPLGFDGAVEFSPNWYPHIRVTPLRPWRGLVQRLKPLSWKLWKGVDGALEWLEQFSRRRALLENEVYNYSEVVAYAQSRPPPPWLRFPGVFPMWDNTARRRKGGAGIILHSTPERFEQTLREAIQRQPQGPVFINAWNEWAEGCHLEPDQKWGRAYLEATARALA